VTTDADPAGAGLLAGIRVLDLGIWRPVPYATQLLVEMGADVIKVEPPEGDPMRVFPDLFAILNAGKRAAAIDLKEPTERGAVLDLARDADVVTEGFRPGVAARLGVGYDDVAALNPRVVYCSISGYGQTGPLRDLPGHDLNYQALAGTVEPRGPGVQPVIGRPPIADLASGVYAAMSVCAALVRATRTGHGEYIDVAMADLLATWTGPLPSLRMDNGEAMQGGAAGYGVFPTADDGWIALGVLAEQHLWEALTNALELPDLAPLDFAARSAQPEALNTRLGAAIGRLARDDAVARLAAAGVPVSPVLGQAELADDPHLRARGVVRRIAGNRIAMNHPVQYRHNPTPPAEDVPPLRRGAGALPGWRTT
jgi:crotonobetainyl-CoA:carnitine CoA-transferase CaiB-like acyl-CoA transferase